METLIIKQPQKGLRKSDIPEALLYIQRLAGKYGIITAGIFQSLLLAKGTSQQKE